MADVLAGLKVYMSVTLRYHEGNKEQAAFKPSRTLADSAMSF